MLLTTGYGLTVTTNTGAEEGAKNRIRIAKGVYTYS